MCQVYGASGQDRGYKDVFLLLCPIPSPFQPEALRHSAYNTHQTQKTSKPVFPLRHSQDIRKPCDKGRLSRPSSASAAELGAARPRPRRQQRVGMSEEVLVSHLLEGRLRSTGEGWKRPTLHMALGTQVMQGAATCGHLSQVDLVGRHRETATHGWRRLEVFSSLVKTAQTTGRAQHREELSTQKRKFSSSPVLILFSHTFSRSLFIVTPTPMAFSQRYQRYFSLERSLHTKRLFLKKDSNKSGGLIKAITPLWKFYLSYK